MLLLARRLPGDYIAAGLAAALRAGALTADAVALEARKAADQEHPASPARSGAGDSAEMNVTFLTERRLAHLPADNRPLPSVAAYDQLLRNSKPAEGGRT